MSCELMPTSTYGETNREEHMYCHTELKRQVTNFTKT